MTWGTPYPQVQRTNNPIIDDRFEKILAWQTAIDHHLQALEDHLTQTDIDIAAFRARMAESQQAAQAASAQAINGVHDQVVAAQVLILAEARLLALAIRQDIAVNAKQAREHAWDDWQANLMQRAGERWQQFWRWLNRPLWRRNAS